MERKDNSKDNRKEDSENDSENVGAKICLLESKTPLLAI
jgi:hypothetical protein